MVISPNTITTPVLHTVSHAIRDAGSSVRHASTMASDITSHNLSGWDSVTDSDANRKVAAPSSSVEEVAVATADAGLGGDASGAPPASVMGTSSVVVLGASPPSAEAEAVPMLAVVDIIIWRSVYWEREGRVDLGETIGDWINWMAAKL